MIDAMKVRRARLPCPFCGSQPEQNAFGYYHMGTESREIRCTNKSCIVRPYIIRGQDEENDFDLIEAWNTRAPFPAALDPVTVEACAKAAMEAFGKVQQDTFVLEGPAGIARRMVKAIRALLAQPAPSGDSK
jgi:hypothetical protein